MTVLLKYAAIRLSLFAVPFFIMVLVGWHPLLAGGLSLIFAALASYIFLRRQKEEVSAALADRAERRKREKAAAAEAKERDENVEDSILDEQETAPDAQLDAENRRGETVTDDDAASASEAADEAPTDAAQGDEPETGGHPKAE
ncbi:MAG TPA: DUF4229 domain-containing protein [Candidatus Agrococcus pullicola]|uniref:DUF4229 domain-containing protein n=1 Tax=Candidatus Agrococcus pullicola TaxID=2838429 RepID=A0A9D2C825_9MICO|nr:DUF4229 domain-containing protein [Candidatus Agrococcus pullicola]